MIRRTPPTLNVAPQLARILSGAWRYSPPEPDLSEEELAAVTPLLLGSGAGPLGWWKVRHSPLRDTEPAQQLRENYYSTALHSALRESHIADATRLLRIEGIESILFKGWAIARVYPDPGLRLLGDIDLYVRPGQEEIAVRTLSEETVGRIHLDLVHDVSDVLRYHSWQDVSDRSELVKLGDADVCIMGPEDHLAYMCIHFLKHGGWRPLWLCDIALALESRPPAFDWDLCLGPDPRRADWIACAIGVAHILLGAEVAGTVVEHRAHHLPPWLIPTVLREWEHPMIVEHTVPVAVGAALRQPSSWMQAAKSRWLSPIEATVRVNGSFNALPRLPYQVADYVLQLTRFLPRLAPFIGHSASVNCRTT